MDQQWMGAMAEATRLTRQGRLAEATALIQRTLRNPPRGEQQPQPPDHDAAGPGAAPPRLTAPESQAAPARGRGLPRRPAASVPSSRSPQGGQCTSMSRGAGSRR